MCAGGLRVDACRPRLDSDLHPLTKRINDGPLIPRDATPLLSISFILNRSRMDTPSEGWGGGPRSSRVLRTIKSVSSFILNG